MELGLMNSRGITLARHIFMAQPTHPLAAELSQLLAQLGAAATIIAAQVRQAALGNLLGRTGDVNIQGEQVEKLDQFANETFIQAFGPGRLVCTLISEEMEQPLHLFENCAQGRYALLVDPIDGSSNIDVNGTIGSIFSFYRRGDDAPHGAPEDQLRKGSEQVAAGYVMYGPSTIVVYTCGRGVYAFTLNPSDGDFFLSHDNIRIPARGRIYSVNEGNYNRWLPPVQRLIDYLRAEDSPSGRPYTARYVGSLVADLHRTLLVGGIYLYPGDRDKPEGKLRLLYEAAPLAFVVEQAGGRASTGTQRILEIHPTTFHQRVPLMIGSPEDVALAEAFVRDHKTLKTERRT